MDLKCCVHLEFLESSIYLSITTDAHEYKSLTDYQVRKLINKRLEESNEFVW